MIYLPIAAVFQDLEETLVGLGCRCRRKTEGCLSRRKDLLSQMQAVTYSFSRLMQEKNMETQIDRQLPEELLMLVLGRLPWQDTFRLRAVCKLWNCILRDPNFFKMCSASRGVPLLLSSAFPETDLTLYYRQGFHKCFLQGSFCRDCDFQLFSPQGEKWSVFPRTWFNLFLHEGLSRTCTRCVRVVAVKGGIFLIFFRRQDKSNTDEFPSAAVVNFPIPSVITAEIATATEERCGRTEQIDKSWSPRKQNSEIVYLVNPFNQTYRRLILPARLVAKGSSLFWMKIKKMIANKQSNTFKILLGPSLQICDKHERCDVWLLDYFDVMENSWSNFSFHLGREVTVGDGLQTVNAGWLYDATIVGDKLMFITCHSDSLFGVWQFDSESGSSFPSRLADIPVLNLYKPSIHERQGRLILLGQSFDMNQFDFSVCVWEYDSCEMKWIPLISLLSELRVSCWNLKGDFGQDFACISVEMPRKSQYLVCDLDAGTCQKLPWASNGRKIFMIEPRLDMQL